MSDQKIRYDELKAFTIKVLENYGYTAEQAEVTARVLVEADFRSVASHGVARLQFYRANIKGGFAFPGKDMPKIVHETPLSVVVDGMNGIGPHISQFAMDKVMEKARAVGAGYAAVRNSNHYGMAGIWAEMAADEGFIGMSFCNTRKCANPTFGRERVLGTNPVCFAVPSAGKTNFMVDMATTTVAHGKIEVYERRDKPMPIGWAVDEKGADTTDTKHFQTLFRSDQPEGGHLFLGGASEDLGGHKGYGMGLFVDVLCAGMSMGSWSKDTFTGTGSGITHFFSAIRTDLFGDADAIADHVESILQQVRDSQKAEGHDRIYIHGEKEAEAREKNMAEGIVLDDATQKLLNGYADEFGLEKLF